MVEKLNPGNCWTYLLSDRNRNCVLIDPVIIYIEDYLKLLKERRLKLTHVIDTHTHADHISAGASLMEATGCEYVMHSNAPAHCVTTRVSDGDVINVAGMQAKVIETPGHTEDSISPVFDNMMFTGDFLFLEDAGAGRDDLPGGSANAHWESLQKLKNIPGHVTVYPAHEYRNREPSSLDNQREKNPHLKITNKDEFVTYISDLKLGPAEWMKYVLKANYKCTTDPDSVFIPSNIPACEIKGTMAEDVAHIPVEYISKDDFDLIDFAILVDVREEKDMNGPLGHIDGIVNIPVAELSRRLGELSPYKYRQIIVICHSGVRSVTAAQILLSQGFTSVKILEGGMVNYRA